MKNRIIALVAAGLAVSAFGSMPAHAGQTAAEKGEARLAKMLDGRTPGAPVKCVSGLNSDKLQVIDRTAIVYDAGKTIYVARPRDPKVLDRNDILVTQRTGSQICTNDSMKMVDRTNHFTTGIVFLEDFVPYTKEG